MVSFVLDSALQRCILDCQVLHFRQGGLGMLVYKYYASLSCSILLFVGWCFRKKNVHMPLWRHTSVPISGYCCAMIIFSQAFFAVVAGPWELFVSMSLGTQIGDTFSSEFVPEITFSFA